jgi:hypothetical protein
MTEPPPTAEEQEAAIDYLGIACCETQVIDRVALLLRALAPFVEMGAVILTDLADDSRWCVGTPIADLRRARRIVRGEEER